MVIALPARSRIDRVGIRTVPGGALTANHVTFEGSLDGRTFKQLTTIKSANSGGPQWFDVPPTQASYIRVTMADSVLPDHDVRLHSVMAQGAEVEPAHAGDISGCWTINGEKARFARRGTHVVGSLETGKEPIRFEGGFDGRIYRLSWVRGNDHGMTLLTVSPDGEHLSATNWHEEAIPMFFDVSWFGEKRQCSETVPDSNDVAIALLSRNGRFSLYGGVDLGALLKMFPDARFVAHEFRFPTAQQNHDATQRACAPLAKRGHPCIAAGSDNPRQEPVTESMRALYSTTDLEIRR